MAEYLVLLFYLLWLVSYYDFGKKKNGANFHTSLLCIFFILLAGLSYRLGVDCIRYEYYFDDVYPVISEFSFETFKLYSLLGDPGWVMLNSLCKFIINEFYVIKIITAIFFNVTLFWFVKKYSDKFFLTILLCYVFNFWNYNYQILRESISIAFFLIAFDKLLVNHKSYLKYYLWIIPALFFHTFAFITLLFPLAFKVNNDHIRRNLLLLVIIIPLLPYLISNVVSLGFLSGSASEKLTEKYLVTDNYSSNSFNIFGILQRVIIALCSLYLVRIVKYSHKKIQSLAYLYSYVMFLILGFPIVVRVTNYLFIPFAICISQTIYEIKYKKSLKKYILLFLFVFTYSEMYLLNEIVWRQYVPYSSIITKEKDLKREQVLYYLLYGK